MKCLFVLGCLIGLTFAKIENLSGATRFMFPSFESTNGNHMVRIVGGQEATPNQFPYQVGLYIDYQLSLDFCGGSLVSKNYVLTAAHCAEGAITIDIVLGAHNISDDSESTRQRLTSTSYVVHPDWDVNTITNDLALIKLPTSAVINNYVQIVKLASGTNTYVSDIGIATGWGKTADDQTTLTDILRFTTNSIYSNLQCAAVDADYAAIIKTTHLCLSGDGKRSICKGDSGGPLVWNGVQVGISSFTYKSCEASKPSVYTRITEYTQWIKDNSDVTF